MTKRSPIARRDFIKTAVGAAAGFAIVPRFVLGGQGYTAPSDELTKAVIGVGGMGKAHLTYEGSRLLAVCDVDAGHLKEALEIGGPGVKATRTSVKSSSVPTSTSSTSPLLRTGTP